jgi:hypothetical protein
MYNGMLVETEAPVKTKAVKESPRLLLDERVRPGFEFEK